MRIQRYKDTVARAVGEVHVPLGDFGVVIAPEPFVGYVGHHRGTRGARGRHAAG